MTNSRYPLSDEGATTKVLVEPFGDCVFLVHEDGGTLANLEVTTNADGEQVLRIFAANPVRILEDEGDGFLVIDIPVASKGYQY